MAVQVTERWRRPGPRSPLMNQRPGPSASRQKRPGQTRVYDVITRPHRVTNVTEWAKRPECWSRVLDVEWELPGGLRAQLIDSSKAARRGRHAAATSGAELTNITAIAAIAAEDWFAVARWAKETHNLQPWQRQIAFTVGQYLSKGWDISPKQAAQAGRLMEEAQRLGFQAYPRPE